MANKLVALLVKSITQLIGEEATQIIVRNALVDIKNPSTQKPTGKKRKALFLDISVGKQLFEKAIEWLQTDDKGNDYVRIEFAGKELILCDARMNESNGRMVLTFTKENQGRWATVTDALKTCNFDEMYNTAGEIIDADTGEVTQPKASKNATVEPHEELLR